MNFFSDHGILSYAFMVLARKKHRDLSAGSGQGLLCLPEDLAEHRQIFAKTFESLFGQIDGGPRCRIHKGLVDPYGAGLIQDFRAPVQVPVGQRATRLQFTEGEPLIFRGAQGRKEFTLP
jgi:hypothetical protein